MTEKRLDRRAGQISLKIVLSCEREANLRLFKGILPLRQVVGRDVSAIPQFHPVARFWLPQSFGDFGMRTAAEKVARNVNISAGLN